MQQKWIPIGKQQPKTSEPVLVALEGGKVTTGQLVPGFGWYWSDFDDDPAYPVATHWMPLPAHPEAD